MNTPANPRADRIVVVDDDARIRDLLRRYLSQEGFDVLLAEDAKALNRVLTRETVDLIVLDLMLPGEDGLSICRRLRAANDATPIIMLTAKVEDVDRIVGLEVGADDYLPKPFNPRELLARIHAVLRRRPAPEAPARRPRKRRSSTSALRVRPVAAPPVQERRADRADHGRVLHAQGPGAPPAPAACRATSWPSWRAAASSSPSTAAWTCRSRACARCSNPTRPSRATSRPSGAWAMCSCRMAPTEMDGAPRRPH
jgi:DNA-binding response OmpR family regulator